MTIENIGTYAGDVYKALENAPEHMMGLKELRKATKLKKDYLLTAMGWLGREGKIVIAMDDEDIVLRLV